MSSYRRFSRGFLAGPSTASTMPEGSRVVSGIGSQPSLTALNACSNRSSHSLRKLRMSLPLGRVAGSAVKVVRIPPREARQARRRGRSRTSASASSPSAGAVTRGRVKASSAWSRITTSGRSARSRSSQRRCSSRELGPPAAPDNMAAPRVPSNPRSGSRRKARTSRERLQPRYSPASSTDDLPTPVGP